MAASPADNTGAPFNLRWGILSCGGISRTFSLDLLRPPTARGTHDVTHTLAAAATSNSASRAADFLRGISAPQDAKAYGSYAELVADPAVDIVYVGTPHSHHYQHARLALEAGKHVLCEKAFTTNGAQARALVELARTRGLFLMEAVWTRHLPLVREVLALVRSGQLGTVYRVSADLSGATELETVDPLNRLVNPRLAGGALLDIGVYSITWVFLALYHALPKGERERPQVSSAVTLFRTGTDEAASVLLKFPTRGSHGIATTHLRVSDNPDGKHTAGPAVRIQGTKGEIQVYGPNYRPERYTIIPLEGEKELKPADVTKEIDGRGLFWQADESARCVRDGKLESGFIDWEESLAIMDVLDDVRRQGGPKFPDDIESLEYPLPGF